jgi:hypothetical protein
MRARIAAAALSLALGACVEQGGDLQATATLPQPPIERRENVSLAAATVALVSIEGAPDAISASFRQALAREFIVHDVVAVEPRKARYLVRGYLAASPAQDGADLEYVWDVYGADHTRLARLNNVIALKGSGDAWSLANDAALASVAAKSAEDLSAFLSNRPEAKPLAGQALSFAE